MQRYVCYICQTELGDTSNWEAGMHECPGCGETNVVPKYSKSKIAILLSCDFCGIDWDNKSPMIEGHRGSVLCLPCLELALKQISPHPESFKCTLCQQDKNEPDQLRWQHPDPTPSPGLNPEASICKDCMTQAERVFKKDKSVDWSGTSE